MIKKDKWRKIKDVEISNLSKEELANFNHYKNKKRNFVKFVRLGDGTYKRRIKFSFITKLLCPNGPPQLTPIQEKQGSIYYKEYEWYDKHYYIYVWNGSEQDALDQGFKPFKQD